MGHLLKRAPLASVGLGQGVFAPSPHLLRLKRETHKRGQLSPKLTTAWRLPPPLSSPASGLVPRHTLIYTATGHEENSP